LKSYCHKECEEPRSSNNQKLFVNVARSAHKNPVENLELYQRSQVQEGQGLQRVQRRNEVGNHLAKLSSGRNMLGRLVKNCQEIEGTVEILRGRITEVL
jgi:hypothetical protein